MGQQGQDAAPREKIVKTKITNGKIIRGVR